ncbi:hypothetical protein Dvina_25430 [Dactylosporangium vinaceum]|uniref:Aminoglycoside phosphotransferase domain-containing protein n=1 Tax=Dactylosporangium vinaceum TaxID=53362 RepID=A0ABV5MDP0_9ACTN|nr:hypothetical protein [Dactylosporangium vinaceum]UAC01100.1 hypothetical protein Dvina_25430 [Dactylosporangium vinaceum]
MAPGWLVGWCRERLGAEPVAVLFEVVQTSAVFGLRLSDGAEVVVKARDDDNGRAAACVAAQAQLAARAFPCPRPLTAAVRVGALAVHAEEYRPGGQVLGGDSPGVGVRYARVFARLMRELATVDTAPPRPSPRWVRWDHPGPGLWPAIPFLDALDQSAVPAHITGPAARARTRLLRDGSPCVLGHADFEAQNLRWYRGRPRTIHDWDSLAWQPEAALAGAASAAFARSSGPPTLPPVGSSAAFLAAYQDSRGRAFTAAEVEVAWAASVWPAAHNARWEVLHGRPPVCGDALRAQAAERLRLAGA